MCDDVKISLDNAIPIGLIVNEILTNSVKYAFGTEMEYKAVDIQIYKSDTSDLTLEICDNGCGVDFENFKQGFGFKLIHRLTTFQLGGDVEYFNQNGLCYLIKLNKDVLA